MSVRRPMGFSPRSGSAYTTRGASAPAVISSSSNSLFPADSHLSQDPDPNAFTGPKAFRVTVRHTARDRSDTTRSTLSTGRRKISGNRSNGSRVLSNGSGSLSSPAAAASTPHRAVPARYVPAMMDADAEMNSPPKLLIAQDLRGKRSLIGITPSESVEMPHPCAHEASRQSVASILSLAPTVMQRSETVMGLNGDNDSYGDGPSRSQSAATSFSLLPRGPVVTEAWARTIVQPLDEHLLYTRGDGGAVGYEELARRRQALRLREQRARQHRHVNPTQRYPFNEQSGYTGVFINGVRRGRSGTHSLDTSCEDVSEVGLIEEEEERARTVQLHERHIIARGTPLLFRRPHTRLFVDETDDGIKSVDVKGSNGRMSEGSGFDGAEALQNAGSNGQRFSANADIFMTSSIMSKRFDPSGPLGATKRPILPSLGADGGNASNNNIQNNNMNNNNNLDANGNSPMNGLSHSDLQCGRESGVVPHSLGSNDIDSSPSAIAAAAALDFALGSPSVLPDDCAVAALLTDPIFVLTSEENFERLVLTQEEHEGHKVLLQTRPWGAAGTSPQGRDGSDRTGALFQIYMTAQSKSPTPQKSHMRFEQPKLARDVQRRRIHSIDPKSYVPKPSQQEQEQQQQEEEEQEQQKQEEPQQINGFGDGELCVSVSSAHTTNNSAVVDPTVALPKKSNSVGCKKRRVRRTETQDTSANHSLEEYPQKRQEKQKTKTPQSTSVGVRAVNRENGGKSSVFPHQQENSNLLLELHLSEDEQVYQSAPMPNYSNVTSTVIPPLPTVVAVLSDVANKSTSTSASLSMNGHSARSRSKKTFPPPQSQPQSQPLSSDRSVRHTNNTNTWSIPYPTESPTASPTRFGSHSPPPRSESIGKESPKASVIGSLWPAIARASPGMSPKSPQSSRSAGTPPHRPSSPASSAAPEEDFLQTSLVGEEDVEIREFVRFALVEQRAKSNEMNTTTLLTSLRVNRRVCTKKTGDNSEVEPCETADGEDEDLLLYDTDHYTENVACILSTFGQLWRTPFHETMNRDKLPQAVQAQLLLFDNPDAKSQ